jgi:hypothetical protein
MSVWLRRCTSFAEEARADRDFWAALTGDERVAAIEELRIQYLRMRGQRDERLRRTVRVLEPARG